eukprot:g8693.t1
MAASSNTRAFGARARGITRVVGGGSAGAGGGRQSQGRRQHEKGGERRGSWAQEGFSFVRYSLGLVCTYHCLKEYVAEPCLVKGPSMRPTIEHGSWLLVDKMGGPGKNLKVGQIVLVRSPLEAGKVVVKRITGLPGDAIMVRPPPGDRHNSHGIERRLEVVPEGHVWLAGDNQENSKDSRSYGSVPQALVEGVVLLRLWPYRDFGVVE